ncbi:MAG: hypothetical protein K6A93_04975 [Bacteroidaceae bacterium]|nr:hypothetical protein [Bacteroidaceae bacterium]
MMIILYLLTGAALSFVLVDIFVYLQEWQSRIHIGRWKDRIEWQQALERTSRRWLKHTPVVRKTSNTRLLLWDMVRGAFCSSTIQKWQDAGLLLGLNEVDARKYTQHHQILFDFKKLEPEDLLLAYVLLKHHCLTDEQQHIILSFYDDLKDVGTIAYRPWLKKVRFVDTIGMVLPFFHACGWDELAIRQLKEYDDALLHGIYPAHAYDLEKKLPLGVHDWSRGIGWYTLGLVEAATLPGNKERIIHLSEAMLQHQNVDGGFSCFVFNQQERMESSGTVLIGLLFVAAYQISQDKRFLTAAFRIEKALMKATRRDGALDYCQGDTYGIGYYSHLFSVMPFAEGLALLFSKKLNEFVDENA